MPPTLIATVEEIAILAGLPLPLDAADEAAVTMAIRDAQADLVAYLGRPVTPQDRVDHNVSQNWDGTWTLTHSPVLEVTAVEAEYLPSGAGSGLYTVRYRAGLDASDLEDEDVEPLRRFVREHARLGDVVQRLVRKLSPGSGRKVTSASTEGQSVSYADTVSAGSAGSGAAGAPPTLASCDRWRMVPGTVYQRPGVNQPWPYGPPPAGSPAWRL
ncbi:hypothetical protein GCM10022221_67400 [Actinocorallia aurea]